MKLWHKGRPERTEAATATIRMDGATYQRLRDVVGRAGIGIDHDVTTSDDVLVQYDFFIEYFSVVDKFEALISLMDEPGVQSGWVGDKKGGRLLIADLIVKLRGLEERLA